MSEIKTLKQTLVEELGRRSIEGTEIPASITDNLNPAFAIRPYQRRALQYFLNYWQEPFEGKVRRNHQLLFHMATGSGKTLLMAAAILHLYGQGYRNFLFFVNSTNIIDKTRDNFLNSQSGKYLFAPLLEIGDRQFSVRESSNFQAAEADDITIVFSTIQGLHMALSTPRENGLTYDDFESRKTVLISDEAHHINADTKKGGVVQEKLLPDEAMANASWEGTVQRIFEANPQNVLLEFTATVDFSDPNLAAKYCPKLITDYTLREFRKDGYSKEVNVLQADLPAFDRALQAVILSQHRRKLFEEHRKNIKPVILFKSKTIKESKAFFAEFAGAMATLTPEQLAAARQKGASPSIISAFNYFNSRDVSLENLAAELRGDFTEDKLIEVNSKEESESRQLAVNSLEDPRNEFRAVFAVDKLNEGWDVLNLFDIVRLYDTRDSRVDRIGKTTMSEAQLIGRGARYCPFKIHEDQPLDQRKYDQDLTHKMRICEELVYHSAYNPRYIQELNAALQEIGIKPREERRRQVTLKDSFKATSLYKNGLIFLNEQQSRDRGDVAGLDATLIGKLYKVRLLTGRSHSSALIVADSPGLPSRPGTDEQKHMDYFLADFGSALVRKAMQRLAFYEFSNLKTHLPHLQSAAEFITSPYYLGCIKVEVSGRAEQVENLGTNEKLHSAVRVLEEIAEAVSVSQTAYRGSVEFKPWLLKEKITEKTLNFAAEDGDDREFGRSMNDPGQTSYHLDLTSRSWFAFEDCFGTSEEKLLVMFIDKHYESLKERYTDVYLIRNEHHFKIYDFDDGRAFEPDFVLYLIGRNAEKTVQYQIFIEPKGGHLLKTDEWKERFLSRLRAEARIEQIWTDRDYTVWGLPFFNSTQRTQEFEKDFSELS